MSEIINETINELNKPTENNIFSIEDDPVTILEKINQVERYLKEIDTHVDTSINTANEALEKANSAFEANGTLVKINGENQLTWSADFAESEKQKSQTDGAIVHEKEIADIEHIETIYDMSSSDSNINKGYTAGKQFDDNATDMPIDLGDYKKLRLCFKLYKQSIVYFDFGIPNNTLFTMCAVCMEPTYSVNNPIMLSVYYSNGNLKCYKAVLGISEGGGNLNNSDNAVLIKVQGVK